MPRWSATGRVTPGMLPLPPGLIAGLSGFRAIVSVDPPLLASPAD